MSSFQVKGNTSLITPATSPPTPVLVVPNDGVYYTQVLVTNLGSAHAFIVWGQSAIESLYRAVFPVVGIPQYGYVLPSGFQVSLTVPPNQYWTAVTLSGTSIVTLIPGIGE